MPEPVYHPTFNGDVSFILKVHEATDEALAARKRAFYRLKDFVRGLGQQNEYELIDSSLSSFSSDRSLIDEPLECFILDKTRPEGLRPENCGESLPLPYDPIRLASLLSKKGYDGTYIDSKPDLHAQCSTTSASSSAHSQAPGGQASWSSNPKLYSLSFDVLPPSLRILPSNAGDPEIYLTPAHPSNLFRRNFLVHLSNLTPQFLLFSKLLWIWAQSWSLFQLPPSLFALMVMHVLVRVQQQENMPALIPDSQAFYLRVDWEDTPQYLLLRTPKLPNRVSALEAPKLLQSIFSLWNPGNNGSTTRAFEPATGKSTSRLTKHKDKEVTGNIWSTLIQSSRSLKAKAFQGELPLWRYHPLVICDPIVPMHNAASSVTKDVLSIWAKRFPLSERTIRAGAPVTSIFSDGTRPLSQSRPIRDSVDAMGFPFTIQRHMYRTVASEFFSPQPIPKAVQKDRTRTINLVNKLIVETYGSKYHVECFGSTRYGVDSTNSDLDLSIVDSERPNGYAPTVDVRQLPVIYNIRHLARTLRRKFKITAVISDATVPIVKFVDSRTGINCDLNVNDQLGIFNTRLIKCYCELYPLLPQLLHAVKKWAKSMGLNDPSGAKGPPTFSSYSLTLMTIAMLQTQALLPNLQSGFEHLSSDPQLGSGHGFWLRNRNDDARTCCDPRFRQDELWRPSSEATKLDLRDALRAWFKFYGYYHDYERDIISIRSGGIEKRKMKGMAKELEERQRQRKEEKKAKLKAKSARRRSRSRSRNRISDEASAPTSSVSTAAMPALSESPSTLSTDFPTQDPNASEAETLLSPLMSPPTTPTELNVVDAKHLPDFILEKKGLSALEFPEEIQELAGDAENDNLTEVPDEDMVLSDSGHNDAASIVEDGEDENDADNDQPGVWANHSLIVADPFILVKNATGNIVKPIIDRFIAECRRASFLLEMGSAYGEILGNETPLQRIARRRDHRPGKGKHRGGVGMRATKVDSKAQSPDREKVGEESSKGVSGSKQDSQVARGRKEGSNRNSKTRSRDRSQSKGRSKSRQEGFVQSITNFL